MKKKTVEDSVEQQAYSPAKSSWIAFGILCVMAFIVLIPLFWIFISSFKVEQEVIQAGGFLYLPKTWTLDNFKSLLSADNKQLPIYFWFVNSIIVSGSQTLLAVLIYSMAAYAYAKLHFKGRDIIFYSVMFLCSFPAITNIIPMYKMMHLAVCQVFSYHCHYCLSSVCSES